MPTILPDPPPLTGLIMYSLVQVRTWPSSWSARPQDIPTYQVKLDIEFADEEAATRFENKIRRLLEDDEAWVYIDARPKAPAEPPAGQ